MFGIVFLNAFVESDFFFIVENVNLVSIDGLNMLTFQVGLYSKIAEDENRHTFSISYGDFQASVSFQKGFLKSRLFITIDFHAQ